MATPTTAVARPSAAFPSESGEKAIDARTDEFLTAWKRHDAAALAAVFAEDGDLINPFGRHANGRGEIERLYRDEHTAFLKASTLSILGRSYRFPADDVAIVDWDAALSGIVGQDGAPMPTQKFHGTMIWVERAGKWSILAGRPVFPAPRPGSPAR